MVKKNPVDETVSTSQLIGIVAEHFEALPKKITKDVIHSFLLAVESNVMDGKKIRLDKVGILQVKDRAARMGRNPQTGEEIKIPETKKITFRPAKTLKDNVAAGSTKPKPKAKKKASASKATLSRKSQTKGKLAVKETSAAKRKATAANKPSAKLKAPSKKSSPKKK